MEDMFRRLKASDMTLDQSQAKRTVHLPKRSAPAAMKGGRVFDNLGTTPYISPTKPDLKGKGTKKKVNRPTRNAKSKTEDSPSPLFSEESDDEMLLTGSSALGSPCKTVRASNVPEDASESSSGPSKRLGRSLNPVASSSLKSPVVPAVKPRKKVSTLDETNRASSKRTKTQEVSKGKCRTIINTTVKGRGKKASGSPKAIVNSLDNLLKEKKAGKMVDESTPKPCSRQSTVLEGKGRPQSLRPFPMNSPLLPRTTGTKISKATRNMDGTDPISTEDLDNLAVNGGLQPFPMSKEDFEECKPSSTSSTSPSSSGSKRHSISRVKGSYLKKRRTSDSILENSFADSSLLLFEEIRDPNTICPFCDMPLPEFPSRLLRGMIERLRRTCYADPRPTNALGMKAPLTKYISLCQRHQFESKLLPRAREKGWPLEIDFEALPDRIRRISGQIRTIVLDKEKSIVWRTLKKEIERKGTRKVMAIAGQFSGFKKTQPGYYGEQGALIIAQTLYSMFPENILVPSLIAPLAYMEFVQTVLIPEAAAILVQEDLNLRSKAEALKVLEESSSYGTLMFPDIDTGGTSEPDSRQTDVGERLMRKHVEAKKKEVDMLTNQFSTGKAKQKKTNQSTVQASDAEDTVSLSSDSHVSTQSEVSAKSSRRSKPSRATKMSSTPKEKENKGCLPSSPVLKTSVAVRRNGLERGMPVKQTTTMTFDLETTPKPLAKSRKKVDTDSPSDSKRIWDQDVNLGAPGKSNLTSLIEPLQITRPRQVVGSSSKHRKTEWTFDMRVEVSDEDMDLFVPPSSSLQRQEITTPSRKKKGIAKSRSKPNRDKTSSKWLLSDDALSEETPCM